MADATVVSAALGRTSPYQRYLEADWGLRNHWYPALFSHELPEGGLKGTTIGGEDILFRRAKGKVYALRDECLHRGVKISARPLCLTDETVTCWYHGFTYELATGNLKTVVAAPEDKLIGKARLRTYRTEEVKGMIFVFLGDEDFDPVPPLAHDLPIRRPADYEHRVAHPLDDNAVLLGIRRTVPSNWRLGAENGIDPGHVLIHRDNDLVLSLEMAFPLGEKPRGSQSIRPYEDPDGPKAVEYLLDEEVELVLEHKELGLSNMGLGNNMLPGLRTTLHLPCLLMVENWPKHGMVQYEWYVALDDMHHHYWQVLAMPCDTERERRDFEFKFENMWKDLALTRGFNDADVFARVQMQPFYESGRGWEEEVLCSLDAVLVAWRRLVAKHARGIQPPPRKGAFATV